MERVVKFVRRSMYHAKKFSMTSLVPHKGQGGGGEPVLTGAGISGGSSAVVKNSTPAASAGGAGKQRLRWTSDLHDRFVDAISQLGGPDSGYFFLIYFSTAGNKIIVRGGRTRIKEKMK